ncbi:MAG: hypothetical protein HYW14_01070, partial [Planctomycetes bacterium]|nr:hypothetical protein [Planctomycetota bacterium]
DWIYYTSHHLTYILKKMSIQELIDGLELVYEKLYSTEVLRKRFQNSKAVLNNMNSALFAFRVNLDWQNVFSHLIANVKELRNSGVYDTALKQYIEKNASCSFEQKIPLNFAETGSTMR